MDISRCNDQECGFRDNSKISWGGDTLWILKQKGHTCSSIYMGIGSTFVLFQNYQIISTSWNFTSVPKTTFLIITFGDIHRDLEQDDQKRSFV